MSKSINSIVWPENPIDAVKKYMRFILIACEAFNVDFIDIKENPLRLANRFLAGEISFDVMNNACVFWWDIVDNKGIRDFSDKDVLNARVAICILSLNEKSFTELGQHLSWFIEIMGFAGFDESELIKIYVDYFTFK